MQPERKPYRPRSGAHGESDTFEGRHEGMPTLPATPPLTPPTNPPTVCGCTDSAEESSTRFIPLSMMKEVNSSHSIDPTKRW